MMVWERMVCQRNFGKLSPQGFPTSCRAFLIAAGLSPTINLFAFASKGRRFAKNAVCQRNFGKPSPQGFPNSRMAFLTINLYAFASKGRRFAKNAVCQRNFGKLSPQGFSLQLTYTRLPVKGEGLPKSLWQTNLSQTNLSQTNLIRPRHIVFHANDEIRLIQVLRQQGANVFLTDRGDGGDAHRRTRLL